MIDRCFRVPLTLHRREEWEEEKDNTPSVWSSFFFFFSFFCEFRITILYLLFIYLFIFIHLTILLFIINKKVKYICSFYKITLLVSIKKISISNLYKKI